MMNGEIYEKQNKWKLWAITVIVVLLSIIVCLAALYFAKDSAPTAGPGDGDTPPVVGSEPVSSSESEPDVSSAEESSSEPAPPGSSIPVVVTPPAPPAPIHMEISSPGVYDTPATYQQLVIASPGVTVKNKTVTQDLFIMDNVGDGAVTLDNVVIKGTLYIYGGRNTVTLSDVSAESVHLQKDNGVLEVVATGNTTLTNTVIKCHAVLTEFALKDGAPGFVRAATLESQKLWYELSFQDVQLDEFALGFRANVFMSDYSYFDTVQANSAVHFTGNGDIGHLHVKHDNVSYERSPGRVTVKDGYNDPVLGGYPMGVTAPDNRGYSNTSASRFDAPTGLTIHYSAEGDSFVASFNTVANAGGYEVVPVVGGVIKEAVQLASTQNSVTILNNASSQLGKQLQFRVRTLGSGLVNRSNSNYISSKEVRIGAMQSPAPSAALDAAGSRVQLSWGAVAGARSYLVTTTVDHSGSVVTSTHYTDKNTFTHELAQQLSGSYAVNFTVSALAADNTGMCDSPAVAAGSVETTVLAPPSDVVMEQSADGSVVGRWKNGAGYAGVQLVKIVNGRRSSAITLNAVEQYNLWTADELKNVQSFSFEVAGLPQSGDIGSVASACSLTRTAALPAIPAASLSVEYMAGAVPGYYATWALAEQPDVPMVSHYLITPVIDGVEQPEQSFSVPKSAQCALLMHKRDFVAGTRVSYKVAMLASKVGQLTQPATTCRDTRVVVRMRPPENLTINVMENGSLYLYHDASADGTANISKYRITPIWDGQAAAPLGDSILTFATIAKFTEGSSTFTFSARALTNDAIEYIDSEEVTANFTVASSGFAVIESSAAHRKGTYMLHLPSGITGVCNITIKGTDFNRTLTVSSGTPITLAVGDQPLDLQGKRVIIAVSKGSGAERRTTITLPVTVHDAQ